MPPSAQEQARRVLAETVRSLEGIERPVLHKMMPSLRAAQKEVEKELREWLASHSGETFTAQRYRNALVVLDKAIRTGGDMFGDTLSALKGSTNNIASIAMANLKREWMHLGTAFEGTVQPLAFEEMAVLASGKRLLWPQFKSSAERYADSIGERTRTELAISRARSETIGELTNRLQRRLPEVFRNERWDAERLARTETMEAYGTVHSEALAQAQEDDPLLGERWDATVDFRRCPMCASLDGQFIHPEKGEHFVAKWTTYSKKGPRSHAKVITRSTAHPNCRCVQTAWRDTWPKFANKNPHIQVGQLAA